MLKRHEILQGVTAIVAREAGMHDASAIAAATRLLYDLDGFPICLLRVWAGLEDRFGIGFSMIELTAYGHRDGLTVGDLVDAVAGKLQLQPAEVAA